MRRTLLAALIPAASLIVVGYAAAPGGAAPRLGPRRAVASTRVIEPRRLALIIGISDYQHFPDPGPPGMSKLHGPAERDVPRMVASLQKWGFSKRPRDMLVLTDAKASRAGIERGFEWLIRQAGDDTSAVVLIYYAGHGSWAPDRNGDEAALDPEDAWDEALVPWDTKNDTAALHDPAQLILDDQIHTWLKKLPTGNVTIIVDACFSGTISRGGGVTPRGSSPPPGGPRALRSGADSLNEKHVLITAATAGQTAAEKAFKTDAGEQVFGILTYYLTEALDAATSATTYDDLMREVRSNIIAQHGLEVTQRPQLDGDREAVLFHVRRAVPPQRVVRAFPAGRDSVALDAGALHGVRVSAVYDLFDSTETEFRGAPPHGQVEIDRVTIDGAIGHRLRDAGTGVAPIPPGARAVLALVPPGISRLERIKVYVAPSAAAVRAFVARLPWVMLADSSRADATVSRGTSGVYKVRAAGGLVVPVDEDTSAGARMITERDTGWSASPAAICRALRRSFAITAFRSIHNPSSPPYLPVTVRVVEGDVAPKAGVRGAKEDTAYIGRHYTVWARVEATVQSEMYASAAVEGYVSPDLVFFPPRGMTGMIPVNEWIPIFQGFDVTEPAGTEVIKVVVMADRPYDLGSLWQSFPSCASQAGGERGVRTRANDRNRVTGWKGVDHIVHILPDPGRK